MPLPPGSDPAEIVQRDGRGGGARAARSGRAVRALAGRAGAWRPATLVTPRGATGCSTTSRGVIRGAAAVACCARSSSSSSPAGSRCRRTSWPRRCARGAAPRPLPAAATARAAPAARSTAATRPSTRSSPTASRCRTPARERLADPETVALLSSRARAPRRGAPARAPRRAVATGLRPEDQELSALIAELVHPRRRGSRSPEPADARPRRRSCSRSRAWTATSPRRGSSSRRSRRSRRSASGCSASCENCRI